MFLVDERYIDPSSDDSNAKLVRDTLPVSDEQLLFPDTSLPIDECVKQYDSTLENLLSEHPADVVTLGMGEDGHIASLFPPVGDDAFGESSAIHTTTDRFAVHDRISVTAPVIAAAVQQVFFLKGEGKRTVWDVMIADAEGPTRWPAKIALENGTATIVAQW